MDETYIEVKSRWTYYYRDVDNQGNTIKPFVNGKANLLMNIDKSSANQADS